MPTPGAMLAELIGKYDISKTALAKRAGVTYMTLNRWTKGEYFDASIDNQQAVLRALREGVEAGEYQIPVELGDDYFSKQAAKVRAARLQHRASVIELFEAGTKVGRSLTDEERHKLQRLDLSFTLDVELCEALVLSMRGKISGDPITAAAKQRRVRLKG
jgi:transcriptional regulator with XRE-family HTH domain